MITRHMNSIFFFFRNRLALNTPIEKTSLPTGLRYFCEIFGAGNFTGQLLLSVVASLAQAMMIQ